MMILWWFHVYGDSVVVLWEYNGIYNQYTPSWLDTSIWLHQYVSGNMNNNAVCTVHAGNMFV